MNEIESFIRQEAAKRGINPDIAVRVARSEGGLSDPYQRSLLRAPGSQVGGGTENSIGPFQLYISGRGAGLGDRALKAGVDPRKDWKAGVQFALDEAAREGWGQWYGWKGDKMAGIGPNAQALGTTLTSTPTVATEWMKALGIEPPTSESPTSADVASDTPTSEEEEPKGWAEKVADLAGDKDTSKLLDQITGKGGDSESADPARSSGSQPISSILPSMEGADMARIQAAQGLMAQLMAKKRSRGLSLTGVPNALQPSIV